VTDARLSCYRGSLLPRLWRRKGDVAAAVLALTLALAAGGCSLSYQLDSLSPKDNVETTGSIQPVPVVRAAHAAQHFPSEGDLAVARNVVDEILSQGSKDASMPWENPQTGARGTITPLASAYSQGGATCRDFLASYVRGPAESWLQGEACRNQQGRWEVRHLKPWRRT
jgi:surface antigen